MRACYRLSESKFDNDNNDNSNGTLRVSASTSVTGLNRGGWYCTDWTDARFHDYWHLKIVICDYATLKWEFIDNLNYNDDDDEYYESVNHATWSQTWFFSGIIIPLKNIFYSVLRLVIVDAVTKLYL